MLNASQNLGVLGEELAYQYLRKEGYKVLLRNYECALGEIDLIAKDKGALVFVEVKTRTSSAMGHPAEAVTSAKQHQILKCAQFYVKRYGIREVPCRFDVVSILIPSSGETRIELIRDAFGGC